MEILRKKSIVSRAFESRGSQEYELVDTNHHSQPVRRPLRRPVNLTPGPLKRILTYPWAIEISSIVISILALTAISVTLAIHSDQPLPQWPHLISINSLIAIFTVVLKATLMMPVAQGIGQLKWHWFHEPRSLIDLDRVDAASRGPWGSFLLIFTIYKHSLAVFGAFITVVALAIEPFTQQVIRYYQCLQPISGSAASIPKTNNYTVVGSRVSGDSMGLDNTMAAALYVGLIQPPVNATSSISFQCSTGNCTFPEDQGTTHSSLAMCSSCTDISGTVSTNKTQTSNETVGLAYSLQSGPTIGWVDKFAEDLQWMSSSVHVNGDSTSDIDYISGFDALMYRKKSCMNASRTSQDCGYEPFAITCFIYACMKTYRASVTNFVLEEEVLNTTRLPMARENPRIKSSFETGFTLLSNSVLRNGTWVECVGADEPSEANPAPRPDQWTTPTEPPMTYYPNDCLWNFGWESTQALSLYFVELFGGDPVHGTLLPVSPATSAGTPWQMGLFSSGTATLASANAYMEGLENAMTSIIRQHGSTPSVEYAQGTCYGLHTCIKVEWAWLALPSVLIILAIVFLLVTICKTRSSNTTWKSSALALLIHGLDARSREPYSEMVDLPTMGYAAEQVQAELAMSEAGWQFVIK